MLSVISDRKAISDDDGIIEQRTSFKYQTNIAPWFAHNQTNAIELTREQGLAVTSSHNLNGIGATYTLEAGTKYTFVFNMDNRMKSALEFGISYNNKKLQAEKLKYGFNTYQINFSPTETGVYNLNLNIRDKKEVLEKQQTFFISDFNIKRNT